MSRYQTTRDAVKTASGVTPEVEAAALNSSSYTPEVVAALGWTADASTWMQCQSFTLANAGPPRYRLDGTWPAIELNTFASIRAAANVFTSALSAANVPCVILRSSRRDDFDQATKGEAWRVE